MKNINISTIMLLLTIFTCLQNFSMHKTYNEKEYINYEDGVLCYDENGQYNEDGIMCDYFPKSPIKTIKKILKAKKSNKDKIFISLGYKYAEDIDYKFIKLNFKKSHINAAFEQFGLERLPENIASEYFSDFN